MTTLGEGVTQPLLGGGVTNGYSSTTSAPLDYSKGMLNLFYYVATITRATIGVPKEVHVGEKRVALTPSGVQILTTKGLSVIVECGAGQAATFTDEQYKRAGATISTDIKTVWGCSVIVKIRKPEYNTLYKVKEEDLLQPSCILLCMMNPATDMDLQDEIANKKGTLVSLSSIPRTTRAQAYDVLSSQSSIAGYRAVLEAAAAFPGQFTGAITAAGKLPPATVLIIGAGVAGLSAAGTAKGMGAIVRAFDTRPAAKEEVETMGAQFLTVEIEEDGTGAGGYAKTMSPAFIKAEMDLFHKQCKKVDIIITTALVPGKKAPVLITTEMVNVMKKGSVVVDLAAEMGGNCELTKPGEAIDHEGVTIVGYTDLLSRVATQSSTMFSNNVAKFLADLFIVEGKFCVRMDDEIVRGATIYKDGALMWPPPPPRQFERKKSITKEEEYALITKGTIKVSWSEAYPRGTEFMRMMSILVLAVLLIALGYSVPYDFATNFFVFILAIFCGWKVIWGVKPSLHSPLMSLTNAISGIIVIGGFSCFGDLHKAAPIMAVIAVALATVNIFGGFFVTQRMLNMFKSEHEGSHVVTQGFRYFTYSLGGVLIAAAYLGTYYFTKNTSALVTFIYLLCSILFIMALAHLSDASNAKRGNLLGMMSMLVALVGSYHFIENPGTYYYELLLSLIPGAIVGTIIAARVEITSLPELVAGFHSLVGLAAVLVSISSYIREYSGLSGTQLVITKVTVYLGVLIGGITFTGSIIAFGKLRAILPSRPLLLPMRHTLTILLFLVSLAGLGYFLALDPLRLKEAMITLGVLTALSFYLGFHLIVAIGGGDMPVVISMLNSYSGWACAADGFLLSNHLLIVTGALVGSSGAILSYVMCAGMGRSFFSVIIGGFGEGVKGPAKHSSSVAGQVTPVNHDEAVRIMVAADKIIIVPGYGMAVSKAQHAIAQLTTLLRNNDKTVLFCVHPVAGRMPGHMNVLLAEANIPYDIVMELDELKNEFASTDAVLVIGANDTVNPSAEDDSSSDIYGMPVCPVWKAKTTIVMKRSMASGYA
eukprot:Ihof_evm2s709 gene=Ihof_evmTU2s709